MSKELIERLRALGDSRVDNPFVFTTNEAATALEASEAEITRLRQENERLRAALAMSDQPCAYCSLPADEWSKCQHGFPGCDRADDAMGCPELGAKLEADQLRKRVGELEEAIAPFKRLADLLDEAARETYTPDSDAIIAATPQFGKAAATVGDLRRARSLLDNGGK